MIGQFQHVYGSVHVDGWLDENNHKPISRLGLLGENCVGNIVNEDEVELSLGIGHCSEI